MSCFAEPASQCLLKNYLLLMQRVLQQTRNRISRASWQLNNKLTYLYQQRREQKLGPLFLLYVDTHQILERFVGLL